MTTCHVFSSLADQTRSLRRKVQKCDRPSRQLMLELELLGTKVRCEDISGLPLRFKPALIQDGVDSDSVN